MLTRTRPTWELPESAATSESLFQDRRNLVKAIAAGPLLLGAAGAAEAATDKTGLYPAQRNLRYRVDRPLTDEKQATTYNNFYEFGSHKQIAREAQKLKVRPWTVTIDGMVEKKIEIDAHDLIRKIGVEERVYRFRCVEAWAMTVPWSGLPMASLVQYAKPLSGAKYVVMETFQDAKMASGQRQFWYPWPYREGLTMEEATNELAFIGTGAYGKEMPKQMGAPLRLVVPWKYGFKSIKSIVRFSFTDKKPTTFWEKVAGKEYGFWANVNPDVSHPRWSQASERVLGTGKRVPTKLYNGYEEQVASLYAGMKGDHLFR